MRKIFQDLFDCTKVNKIKFIYLSFLVTLSALLNIVYINFIKELFNSVIAKDVPFIILNVIFIICSVFLMILMKRYKELRINEESLLLKMKLRLSFFKKLNSMPLTSLNNFTNADLITRYNEDIDAIAKFNIDTLLTYISNVLNFSFIVVYITLNNVYLLGVLIIAPLLVFASEYYGKKCGDYFSKRQPAMSELNTRAKDIFDNVSDIRVFGAQDFFRRKYVTSNNRVVDFNRKIMFFDVISWVTSVIGYQTIYIIFYVGGGFLAFYGYMSFGVIVSLFVMIDPLVDYIRALPSIIPGLHMVKTNINRYNEIISEKDYASSCILDTSCNKYTIDFSNINYSYDKKNYKPVLKNINLQCSSDERVIIIGKSGSGKSTLLKLSLGFDMDFKGKIYINGQSINELDSCELKKVISYLPQEFLLLNQTIIQNIDYMMDQELNMEDVTRYARLAEIDKDIAGMSEQLDTVIENSGGNISIGQKQRIGILIALIKAKPITILDECFSALNYELSINILANIFENTNSGFIMVTHTIYEEVINRFDKIVIMNEGEIIAMGSYDEIKENEYYKSLEKQVEGETL
jgi:ABC-type multidrug transport system fused ATPase/permease subunit